MPSQLQVALRHLVADDPSPAPVADLDAWWARHHRLAEGIELPVQRAMLAGFAMDRLGYAFVSGYIEALAHLVPAVTGRRCALSATEVGGGHPRSIRTRLVAEGDDFVLSGEKEFTTLGHHAEELLVVASVGEDDHGRNRLRVCRIPTRRAGVTLEEGPATPFAPEIPHARLRLEQVQVGREEVLGGDGYETYVKPFRTVEDCHVFAAVIAYLMQVGRRSGWEVAVLEDLQVLACAIFPLALAEPGDAVVHVALGGLHRQLRALVDRLDWKRVDRETRERWERDRGLLDVAGKARARRREVAWNRLGGP